MVSLVLKFINILRKQSDSFDVRTVDPRAVLNYVDQHLIGIQNLGRDSLHTVNWKKSLHTAKVTMDTPTRQSVPTTLSTISSEDQLMINDKGFSASNWLIYPGISMARKTLRSLHGLTKGQRKAPMAKLIHTQVLDILYELCWLNLYTNSIAKGRRSRK